MQQSLLYSLQSEDASTNGVQKGVDLRLDNVLAVDKVRLDIEWGINAQMRSLKMAVETKSITADRRWQSWLTDNDIAG